MKHAYLPRLQERRGHNYIYKQVRVTRADGTATTVSFDWLAYSTLLRERKLSARQFGRLVRNAHEQLEAEGFTPGVAVSRQVWNRLTARLLTTSQQV
jgi:hypothetical protein